MQYKLIGNLDSDLSLVFIHGWACGPEDFDAQIEFFKKYYRVNKKLKIK